MRSGDGLVVRVRPRLARLTAAQALGLCALALRYGSGMLDLTNRANLQIRGVAETAHAPLLEGLRRLGLLDTDPLLESRRNVLVSPFWAAGDVTERLARALHGALPQMPELPAKVGFAVDTGPVPLLAAQSADVRLERSESGLLLRANGEPQGMAVSEDTAIPALLDVVRWFAARQTAERRRMAQVVAADTLPAGWRTTRPRSPMPRPEPGPHPLGALLGVPFGQLDAEAWAGVIGESGAHALRLTPWRLFLLHGGGVPQSARFISRPGNPLLDADACPGAPFCAQATVETRALAEALAPRTSGSLHVSGCAKGCARAAAADVTLVGRNGRFDLVERGRAWDAPERTGLSPADLLAGAT